MDSRWEAYSPSYTQELFEFLSETLITPNKHVPEVVRLKLSQVKSVYRLRSVDYELQDIALFLIIMAFELALRIKYEDVNGSETSKGLIGLLYWAKKKKYLNIEKKRIEFIVTLRNGFAHTKRPEDLLGTLASFIIAEINDKINELYKE